MIKFVKIKSGVAINMADIKKISVQAYGNNDYFSVVIILKNNDVEIIAGFGKKENAEKFLDKAIFIINNFPREFVSFDQVNEFEVEEI